MSDLKTSLKNEIVSCMKSGDKKRLGALRQISAAIKQREVDERIELSDHDVITVLDKMGKQRRESIEQFEKANRTDLADAEKVELEIIQSYLPEALPQEEIDTLIADAIEKTGAASIKDMGKVMGILKPQLQGRADMSAVSSLIRARLNA